MKGLQKFDTFNLDLAIDWISGSGIQETNGGFYAWYDCEKERYSFLYPETTGYAIQLLVKLYRKTGDPQFLRKAIKAGNWLLNIQKSDGSFYCKYFIEPRSESYDRSFYVFDAGIILSGLVDLFEITSNMKYLESSLKISNMILKLQNRSGSFKAGYDPKGRVMNNHHWSETEACHHLKILLPLLKMHKITGDDRYVHSARRLLEWGVSLQEDSGRFITFFGSNETYSHAHCYAVEGLLVSSQFCDCLVKTPVSERIIFAAKWLSNMQNKDGSIWNWHNSNRERTKVSDALSQMLRILILLKTGRLSGVKQDSFDSHIKKGFKFLQEMQCKNRDNHSFGGMYYEEKNGEKLQHVNTCATLFAIHAASLAKGDVGSSLLDIIF